MNIVRHVVAAAIVLPCAAWGPTVHTASEDTPDQVQQPAPEDELVSHTSHAEKVYRHRLARLHRLRELAAQRNDEERLRSLDGLLERLQTAHGPRIDRMRSRRSKTSPRQLEVPPEHGPDHIALVASKHQVEARELWRHEAVRKHHAVVRKHHAEPSPVLVEPHQIVSHRRAEAQEHAAAQKERAERWRAAKEHAAGDRRAEAHEHAAAQKERAERWRADARQRALRHRRAGTQRRHDKVQRDASEHARPADVPRQVPKHKRGAATPGQTLKHKGHPRPERTGHGKHAPTQARADVATRAAITRANFNAEFEKLRKEIESDG